MPDYSIIQALFVIVLITIFVLFLLQSIILFAPRDPSRPAWIPTTLVVRTCEGELLTLNHGISTATTATTTTTTTTTSTTTTTTTTNNTATTANADSHDNTTNQIADRRRSSEARAPNISNTNNNKQHEYNNSTPAINQT